VLPEHGGEHAGGVPGERGEGGGERLAADVQLYLVLLYPVHVRHPLKHTREGRLQALMHRYRGYLLNVGVR